MQNLFSSLCKCGYRILTLWLFFLLPPVYATCYVISSCQVKCLLPTVLECVGYFSACPSHSVCSVVYTPQKEQCAIWVVLRLCALSIPLSIHFFVYSSSSSSTKLFLFSVKVHKPSSYIKKLKTGQRMRVRREVKFMATYRLVQPQIVMGYGKNSWIKRFLL